ncbi:MAG: fused MFS/spermidine synthase [Chloroflexi bacterium]|nr:fused MFS/spermidine synthase [Chloroflexota bacterium]
MRRISTLWKANAIAFNSSFCVMVIELLAARILAPYIGVSLYTWTSIIGIILAGIALGNYLGGRIADRYASPNALLLIFFAGSLATILILPATKIVASSSWFNGLPFMLGLVLKIFFIFFLPAIILSMVSPLVIKLTLADLGRTGGVVGTIYAFSTVGSILGTFMTGFFFILWFGTRTVVWLVAAVLILTGIIAWFSWRVPERWHLSLRNFMLWAAAFAVILVSTLLFQSRETWQAGFTRESNYYAIQVYHSENDIKVLSLDHLIHSYVIPDDPTFLKYDYLKTFEEIVRYTTARTGNFRPRLLHLGGGGYSFPRYMETIYPGSVNEVVEIDPAVTEVAYEELGLPLNTTVRTYTQDARLFLIQRKAGEKYDIVIGDVFNDFSTPYHLTTLEFDRLVKANMATDGLYLVNIIDDYSKGRYMPSFIHTLRQVFRYVYVFSAAGRLDNAGIGTFVIVASDRGIDLADYKAFVTQSGTKRAAGTPGDESKLEEYLAARKPVLLTDDYAPTDILIAPLFRR